MKNDPAQLIATIEVAHGKLLLTRMAMCGLLNRAPANITEMRAMIAGFDDVLASLKMGLEMSGAEQFSLADESPSKEIH